jgi:hypothetical protein
LDAQERREDATLAGLIVESMELWRRSPDRRNFLSALLDLSAALH